MWSLEFIYGYAWVASNCHCILKNINCKWKIIQIEEINLLLFYSWRQILTIYRWKIYFFGLVFLFFFFGFLLRIIISIGRKKNFNLIIFEAIKVIKLARDSI